MHIVTIEIGQVHLMLRCTADAMFACVKLPIVHILLYPNLIECSGMIVQHTLVSGKKVRRRERFFFF